MPRFLHAPGVRSAGPRGLVAALLALLLTTLLLVAAAPALAQDADEPTDDPDVPFVEPDVPAPPGRWDLEFRLEYAVRPGTSLKDVAPTQADGGYVAKILERTAVWDTPNGRKQRWTAERTSIRTGNATRLMIDAARFDAAGVPWLRVQLPIRPNGTTGWIRAESVLIEHTPWYVRVRLASRKVSIYDDGRLVRSTKSVIGASRTPTPTGLFAIYEIALQRSPQDFLGPWALHLTSFSNVLDNYGGGPGRVAIHGRGPESRREAALGTAGSHGCVRVPSDVIVWMHSRTLAGTPFRITKT